MSKDEITITVEQRPRSISYTLNVPMGKLINPNFLTLDMQQRMSNASEKGDVAEALQILSELVRNIQKGSG